MTVTYYVMFMEIFWVLGDLNCDVTKPLLNPNLGYLKPDPNFDSWLHRAYLSYLFLFYVPIHILCRHHPIKKIIKCSSTIWCNLFWKTSANKRKRISVAQNSFWFIISINTAITDHSVIEIVYSQRMIKIFMF